jgi:hypothetical protein
MVVLANLGSQVYKISCSRVDVLILYVLLFGVMNLTCCDFTMDPTKEEWVCSKFYAYHRKSAMETVVMIRQIFGEESMSCTWVFERHVRLRASRTSIEDNQHAGRPISCTTLNTVAILKQLVCEDWHQTIQDLADEIVIGYGTCQWILTA